MISRNATKPLRFNIKRFRGNVHTKNWCYLLHTAVCYFNNKCVKFLIQHTKRAEITHYTLGQLFNTLQFCGRALLLR